jgi:hypothetical protein
VTWCWHSHILFTTEFRTASLDLVLAAVLGALGMERLGPYKPAWVPGCTSKRGDSALLLQIRMVRQVLPPRPAERGGVARGQQMRDKQQLGAGDL